jgi:hypothetical protein
MYSSKIGMPVTGVARISSSGGDPEARQQRAGGFQLDRERWRGHRAAIPVLPAPCSQEVSVSRAAMV